MRGPRARGPLVAGTTLPEPAASPDHARKTRAAGVSILSNALLIVLKLVTGVLTGSLAILTEAVHSSVDLVASIIAFFSVRAAEQPADELHPYGHAKVENLAAALEAILILAGAGVIVVEASRRLTDPPEVERVALGVAVLGFSCLVNVGVSSYLYRQARATDSPALEGDAAHLRTDALTSLGVLVGLLLVAITDLPVLDPLTALLVAVAIVVAGLRLLRRATRVLVDEALPEAELMAVRRVVEGHEAEEVIGFHKLRGRRAGSRRYVDLHVQFRDGTSLERAHELAHELERDIARDVSRVEVLIHLEPESAREGRGGASAAATASSSRRDRRA